MPISRDFSLRPLSYNFPDFPGPNLLSETFQGLENVQKYLRDFLECVGSLCKKFEATYPDSSTTGAWSKPSRLSTLRASWIVTSGLNVTGDLSIKALTGWCHHLIHRQTDSMNQAITHSYSPSNHKKARLMQRETRDSSACLKAHCEQNLSSPIPAIDTGHDTAST